MNDCRRSSMYSPVFLSTYANRSCVCISVSVARSVELIYFDSTPRTFCFIVTISLRTSTYETDLIRVTSPDFIVTEGWGSIRTQSLGGRGVEGTRRARTNCEVINRPDPAIGIETWAQNLSVWPRPKTNQYRSELRVSLSVRRHWSLRPPAREFSNVRRTECEIVEFPLEACHIFMTEAVVLMACKKMNAVFPSSAGNSLLIM